MAASQFSLHFITMAFNHHSNFSGYHRFLDYLPHAPIRHLPISTVLTKSQRDNLIENSWRTWYHYKECVLNEELNIQFYTPLYRKHIFHFLYGENTFCYSADRNRRNKRFVASYHWPESWFLKQGDDRYKALTDKIKVLDAAIAVSSDLAQFLKQYNDKVFCIHHGIDTNFFVPGDFERRDRNLCLFVGNWLRDFSTLIQFAELAARKCPGLKLEVITPEKNLHFFEGSGIRTFSGISDEELRRKYQEASVLIQPLIDCTANNSALEAMACGLPVIASDVGGIRDYLTDECAVLCRPNDAAGMLEVAMELLRKPDRLLNMGVAARKRAVEFFDWSVVSKNLTDVYMSL